jgi:superfamily I DNA/RNA helicase
MNNGDFAILYRTNAQSRLWKMRWESVTFRIEFMALVLYQRKEIMYYVIYD